MPWLAAAHAIEQADKHFVEEDDLKGKPEGVYLGLNLHRARSMARCCWDYIPPDVELRRVGLDIKEVRKEVEEWRTGPMSNLWKHEGKRHVRQLMKANRCMRDSWLKDAMGDNDCSVCELVQATIRA